MASWRTDSRSSWLLLIASMILLACVAVRGERAIARGNSLNFVSGAWMTLAQDLSHGTFYRPLVADDGFGGTRFFPLQFVAHAALIRMGVGPIAALNVWGLAALVKTDDPTGRRIGLASVFFVLAFAAKITTVFGVAAGVLALGLAGEKRSAWRLAAFTAVGGVLVLTIIHVASGGRALESFLACASGDTSLQYFGQSPIRVVTRYIRYDAIGLALAMLAIGALAAFSSTTWRHLPALALLTTLAVTLVIFGSPGTDYNHLLDLDVMSILFLLHLALDGPLARPLATGVLAVVCIVAGIYNAHLYGEASGSRRDDMLGAVAATGRSHAPLLSDDPMLSIVAGERPYVLDSWMLRIIADRDPAVMSRLAREMQSHKFRAVVLGADPERQGGSNLEQRVFGKGFVDALTANYRLSRSVGRFAVYLPKAPDSR